MKNKLAKVDAENGCEKCWSQLAADCRAAGLRDPRGRGDGWTVVVPAEWVGRECPHDPPDYARSILLA